MSRWGAWRCPEALASECLSGSCCCRCGVPWPHTSHLAGPLLQICSGTQTPCAPAACNSILDRSSLPQRLWQVALLCCLYNSLINDWTCCDVALTSCVGSWNPPCRLLTFNCDCCCYCGCCYFDSWHCRCSYWFLLLLFQWFISTIMVVVVVIIVVTITITTTDDNDDHYYYRYYYFCHDSFLKWRTPKTWLFGWGLATKQSPESLIARAAPTAADMHSRFVSWLFASTVNCLHKVTHCNNMHYKDQTSGDKGSVCHCTKHFTWQ